MRNSWGTSWGDRGYAKVAITKDGLGICRNQIRGQTYNMKVW